MSGTSADAVLVSSSGTFNSIRVTWVGVLAAKPRLTLRDEVYRVADAALDFAGAVGVESSEIDMVGSHGQMICNLPRPENGFGATFQAGNPAVIT